MRERKWWRVGGTFLLAGETDRRYVAGFMVQAGDEAEAGEDVLAQLVAKYKARGGKWLTGPVVKELRWQTTIR